MMSTFFSLCFLILAAMSGILGNGQVCSQFDWLEKTLEKMIRVEHLVQSTNDKMSQWEQIMDDNIKRLDNQKKELTNDIEKHFNNVQNTLKSFINKWNETLQNQLSEIDLEEERRQTTLTKVSETFEQERTSHKEILNIAINGFQDQVGEMIFNISNQQIFLDNKISETIELDQTSQTEMLDTVIDGLQDQVGVMFLNISNQQAFMDNAVAKLKEELVITGAVTPTVLFQARHIYDTFPSSGDTLRYKTVDKNLHSDLDGGYDSATGVFKAPVSGTYLFTVQSCITSKRYIYIQVIAAEKVLAAMTYKELGTGSHSTCYSGSAVTTLSAGDTAYIKCNGASSRETLGDYIDYYWNMFSGVLIHTGT